MIRTLLKVVSLLLLGITAASGQSELEIKTSGQFYWGEAQGETLDAARDAALQELVNGISVTVSARSSSQMIETNDGVQEDFRSLTETLSRMTLKGVAFRTGQRRGRPLALAYISREDYRRSLDAMADEVRSMLQLNSASSAPLGTLYEIFLRCYFSPEPISYTAGDQQTYPDVRAYLKKEITGKLRMLSVSVEPPSIDLDVDLVTIPISVSLDGQAVQGLRAGIVGSGEEPIDLPGGRGDLYLYSLPEAPRQTVSVTLQAGLPGLSDPDLLHLQTLYPLESIQTINVDFSKYIRTDFSSQLMANGALLFTPVHQGFGLSRVDWDFGDGSYSQALKPLHKFKGAGPFQVSLWFNNRPDFRVEKHVWPDGRIESVSRPSTPPLVKASLTPEPPAEPVTRTTQQPEIIQNLMTVKTYPELQGRLEKFKTIHRLMYGKRSTFVKPESCYIFVVNPGSGDLLAILAPGLEEREDILSGRSHQGLSDFKGNATIYVEIDHAD